MRRYLLSMMEFFWSNDYPENSWMSNWHPCRIVHDGREFSSSEQLFMYLKASLFGDDRMKELIAKATTPRMAKARGRKVAPFDETIWRDRRVELMTIAVRAKFSQNEDLKDKLLSTGESLLVEASPYDRVWGIGMRGSHRKAKTPSEWRGLNLLGEVLMEIRREMRE